MKHFNLETGKQNEQNLFSLARVMNICQKTKHHYLIICLIYILSNFLVHSAFSSPKEAKKPEVKTCKAEARTICKIDLKEAANLFKDQLKKQLQNKVSHLKFIDKEKNCGKHAEVFAQTSGFISACLMNITFKYQKKKHTMFCNLEYNLNQGTLALRLCQFENDEDNSLLESLIKDGFYSSTTMNDILINSYRERVKNHPISKETVIYK